MELKEAQKKIFQPFEIEVDDINKALAHYSKHFGIETKFLDFDIVSVKTISKKDGEEDSLRVFDTGRGESIPKQYLDDEKVKLSQKYTIVIKSLEEDQRKVEIVLSADKFFTRVLATIKKESKIVYYPYIDDYIYKEIVKKMAKHKILIGVFDETLRKDIDVFAKVLKAGRKLEEDYKLVAAHTESLIAAEDDKITFYFEEKRKIDEERPDFYNRGFIVDVEAGEILVEYVKPKEGKSGRDVMGRYIKMKEASTKNEPAFDITEHVRREETDSLVRYIALRSGYVSLEDRVLDVQEELKVTNIDFKKTGSIIVDKERDITLDITESNPVVDAIGSNMTVKAKEVIVHGSVGDKAKVYADKAVVNGLTHSNSEIYAERAEVAIHKGYLEAKEAKIERCEGGEVMADTVRVGHAANCKIKGRNVYIANLGSNCTITASSLIDINIITGDDDRFIFEAGATPMERKLYEAAMKREEKILKEYEHKLHEFKNLLKFIDDNKESATKLKAIIDDDAKKGFAPKEGFIVKYGKFVKTVEAAKVMKPDLDDLKASLEDARHDVATFKDKLLDARLVNHDIWKNYHTVLFRLNDGHKEYKYHPKEGYHIKEIGLFKVSDTEYSIGEVK